MIIILSNQVIDHKLDYIHNNPVEEGIVENPEDYLYSSDRNYAKMESLIEIDFIRGRSCKLRPGKGTIFRKNCDKID